VGFGFRLDPTARVERDGRTLWGGTNARLVRLTSDGARELALEQGTSGIGWRLGRRLVAAGLLSSLPPRRQRRDRRHRCAIASDSIVTRRQSGPGSHRRGRRVTYPQRVRCLQWSRRSVDQRLSNSSRPRRNAGVAAVPRRSAFSTATGRPRAGSPPSLVTCRIRWCAVAPGIQPLPSDASELASATSATDRRCRCSSVTPCRGAPCSGATPTAALRSAARRSAKARRTERTADVDPIGDWDAGVARYVRRSSCIM
jgi:hypothetical protein